MTHTPGPWFSPDGKTIKQDYRQIGLSDAAGCMIGAVMGGSTSGPAFIEVNDEVAANTKLICAAPDLFKELSFVVETEEQSHFEQWLARVTPSGDCESVQAQWLDSSDFEDFCDIWSGPIAALNKARGNNQ